MKMLILLSLVVLCTATPTRKRNELLDEFEKDVEKLINIGHELKRNIEEKSKVAKDHVTTETEIDANSHEPEILTLENYKNHHMSDSKTELNEEKNLKDKTDKTLTEVEINEMNNYEGDEMELTPEQRKRGVGTGITLWPRVNGQLIVPYDFSNTLAQDSQNKIKEFIGQMNNHLKTCNPNNAPVWRPKTNQEFSVQFTTSTGCSSFLGRVNLKPQPINLARGCIFFNQGTVLHEMLHAMGFSHEQSRSDRDQFVTINFANIQTGRERNFLKEAAMIAASRQSIYDYGSVMHYGATAFSKNQQQTIFATYAGATIGQRNGMSTRDIAEVNAVYQCGGNSGGTGGENANVISDCDFSNANSNNCKYLDRKGTIASSGDSMKVTGPVKRRPKSLLRFRLTKANLQKAGTCAAGTADYCFLVDYKRSSTNAPKIQSLVYTFTKNPRGSKTYSKKVSPLGTNGQLKLDMAFVCTDTNNVTLKPIGGATGTTLEITKMKLSTGKCT